MVVKKITNKELEKYRTSFIEQMPYTFSYGYKWTESWADQKVFDGKSFKEKLVYNNYSLWYFYEYFLRDAAPIPFFSFAEIFFKIDFYTWVFNKINSKSIIIDKISKNDLDIINKIAKRDNIKIKVKKIIKKKIVLKENHSLSILFIKLRIFFRYLISKTYKNNKEKVSTLILTNDRHSFGKAEEDAFFGSVINELKDSKISHKIIEYDRIYSTDNIAKMLFKYSFQKRDSVFIGEYYNYKTIIDIFKQAKYFSKLGRDLISNKKFRQSLKYKDIDFYDFTKGKLSYLFKVMSYYISDILIITDRILALEKSKVILLEHEKNFYDKGIIVNAKDKNTKTICFEGELVYDINDFLRSTKSKDLNNKKSNLSRPLPDFKFLWGDYSRDWFVKNAHYPKSILKIIGPQRYDYLVKNFKKIDKNKVLSKYNLDKNKKVVMIISGATSMENFISKSIESLKDENVQLIFKLHPDEGKNVVKYIKQTCLKFNISKYKIFKYVNFNELLKISDLILSYPSTLGYDIIAVNKPLIIVVSNTLTQFLPYIKDKIVPVSKDLKPLKLLVRKALKGELIQSKRKEDFINKVLFRLDGEASKRAVKLIEELL